MAFVTSLLPFEVSGYRLAIWLIGSILLSPFLVLLALITKALVTTVLRLIAVHITHSDIYDDLPCPKWPDWRAPLLGHIPKVWLSPPAVAHLDWIDEVQSNVYVYRGLFYSNRIFIADPRAVTHILSQAQCYDYPKPKQVRKFLTNILGEGILSAEGDTHKRQRKIVSPAFSVSSVRAFTPSFFKRAHQLVRTWDKIVEDTQGPDEKPFILGQSIPSARASRAREPVFDVSFWLSKVTLDIIGECGFGHDFRSLELTDSETEDDLASQMSALFKQISGARLWDFLRTYLQGQPGLQWIQYLPSKRAEQRKALYNAVMGSAQKIIAAKRAEISKESEAIGAKGEKLSKAVFDEDLNSTSISGKDLLHLIIRANMASDVKQSEKLDDEELLGQMTSFLLAGHETTSTQTTWALWALASRPQVVEQLRNEIEQVFGDRNEISHDELIEMQYLDCVSKEMLRCYSPVTSTIRHAYKDDIIPLGSSYPTKDGQRTFNSVPIQKGSEIIIPIQVLNKSKSIWGENAFEFDPSRWFPENLAQGAKDSGLPLHLATFISGPRGCVGNRFAIVEFKVLLVTLVRHFDFTTVPGWEVEARQEIVTRSKIKGQEDVGMQMPLRVARVSDRKPSLFAM